MNVIVSQQLQLWLVSTRWAGLLAILRLVLLAWLGRPMPYVLKPLRSLCCCCLLQVPGKIGAAM